MERLIENINHYTSLSPIEIDLLQNDVEKRIQ